MRSAWPPSCRDEPAQRRQHQHGARHERIRLLRLFRRGAGGLPQKYDPEHLCEAGDRKAADERHCRHGGDRHTTGTLP